MIKNKGIYYLGVGSMNETIDSILYMFFYLFPIIMLIIGAKFELGFGVFPFSIRVVDLITPYLLLSIAIQTKLVGMTSGHLYFYIFINLIGVLHASYLAFVKRKLLIGSFFRTWWRYTFIFSFIYHLFVGGYGILINLF